MIVGVFEPVLLLDRCGVGQVHFVAFCHQSIDQPVPVVGRLHHDPFKLGLIDRELREDQCQIVGQALLIDNSILFIDHGRHVISRVQIDRSVSSPPLSCGVGSSPTLLPLREAC